MTSLHLEDALNFLIEELAHFPVAGTGNALARQRRAHGSDIWINDACNKYWQSRGHAVTDMAQDDKEPYIEPFYDAAWELSRRGILRPAAAVPAGQTSANQLGQRVPSAPFFGDGYSLTAWGRVWVQTALSERTAMPSDHGRITEVLHQFKERFGQGYAQRAAEAVADWRTGNYLSACTMAGAAAESVLIATAVAKSKDEQAVLAEYRTTAGRSRVVKRVTAGVTTGVGERFNNALGLLTYWRDEAGHGSVSNIGEVEAHEAILGLLRLVRMTADNWEALTM
jgi:hypothetical protein